jgi:hypothetical protein
VNVTLVLVGSLSFLAGVVVGIALREAHALAQGGHTVMVTSVSERLDRFIRSDVARRLGLTLIAISLLANVLTGFLSIATRTDQTALNGCLVTYNTLDGLARDERDEQQTTGRTSAIELWTKIREEIAAGRQGFTRGEVVAAIDAYVATLEALDETVAENPYPPADLCAHPADRSSLP